MVRRGRGAFASCAAEVAPTMDSVPWSGSGLSALALVR